MSTTPHDPKQAGDKPPLPKQKQSVPGTEREMNPKPDHGEDSYQGHGELEGRAAVITGADSGIGRAVAIAFAREGADVVISFLEEEEDAEETAHWVEKAGRKAVLLPGDVRDKSYCQKAVQTAEKEFGKLDVLVNNAAFQMQRDSIEEVAEEELDRTFRTNVYGTFFLTQAALPKMKGGSSIINTCSIEAYTPAQGLLAYAATKAALVNLTKSLAKLASKQSVRVNGVAPGPVWTPLIPSTMPEEKVKEFGKNTVFERPAQPREMAPVYVFLASDQASYVSGEIYGATGGRRPF